MMPRGIIAKVLDNANKGANIENKNSIKDYREYKINTK